MNCLNDLIENNNREISLSLFDNDIKISASRNVYTQLRKKYSKIANALYERYMEVENSYKKLDDLIEKTSHTFYTLLNEAAQETVNDALSIGINSLDVNTVLEEYKSGWYLNTFKKAYNEFYEPYNAAMEVLEERKNTRRAVDMVCGDANDYIISAMYNAGDKSQAKSIFKELFKNSSLRNQLRSAVWSGFFNFHFYIVDSFPKKCGVKLGGFVTSSASKNADGMFNNITNPSLSPEQKRGFAVQIIENNPYSGKYYITLNEIFPENTYELVKLAEFFGADNFISSIVKRAVELAKTNLGTTESDAEECRYMLNQKIAEYGLSAESAAAAFAVIDDRCALLDTEYRTVEGAVFETRDEADSARADIENNKGILEKSCALFIFRNDYVSHIDAIQKLSIPQPIKDIYTARYQIKLNEFDKNCELAELYEQKQNGEKHSFKSMVSSAVTSSEKQKQAWETVTQNGTYKLSEITAGKPMKEAAPDILNNVSNIGNAAMDKAKESVERLGGLFSKKFKK